MSRHVRLAFEALWHGVIYNSQDFESMPPQYIDIQDNARVHVSAFIFLNVKSERLSTSTYLFILK
jgi:hypothetical protein